jgi:hypothetical protein
LLIGPIQYSRLPIRVTASVSTSRPGSGRPSMASEMANVFTGSPGRPG